ncbi:adenylate kinase family protein [Rhodopirellula sp. P2]|uniref:adenylate kinase family protein n=1 Tax=Rhodopirellula sp. P2 TaxID=2127060 RepID=UPI002367CF54|nr:nucleoside monophosphate kinase [Rhodopirellula sp. P2]WDQ18451.1 nucleoside monophosphate kinase [Rhodopirellula sp. P2]
MRIVFIGPPGAGKGTQCQLLSKALRVPHIGTGGMLRALEPERGEQIHLRIDRGHFAPDEFVLQMVAKRLAEPDSRSGYLLDGFPRTQVQASAFDQQLMADSVKLDHVLHLQVSADVLIKRLRKRGEQEKRADDAEECIRERFRIYEARTEPLLDHYRQQGLVRDIDASVSEPRVHASIWERLQPDALANDPAAKD